MNIKLKKLIYFLLFLGIFLLILLSLIFYQNWQAKKLRVTFCDVGQGDAILIQTPYGQDILIDGGPDSAVLNCLGNNLPFYDRKINLIILSHPHADHVVGLVSVLRRYEVERVLHTGVSSGEPAYQEFLKIIQAEDIEVIKALSGQVFNLGPDLRMEIFYPLTDLFGLEVKNKNNSSIVNKLVYQDKSFLFTGDLEIEGEEMLLMTNKDLKADVLKIGHHGSPTSSSPKFLEAVQPEIAVIQVGEENKFGHPSLRTIRRLERVGARIWRNDLEGEINLISDGRNIWKK